ncbi:MAG: aromatic amino acid lyase [Rhodoferax sp.]|nr:aromatic amino acid lyase [Rhodoferax sp.]
MPLHLLDSAPMDAPRLLALAGSDDGFAYSEAALARLAADRVVVQAHVAAGEPVYGLNTGLGGNLGYRLDSSEVLVYQQQIIRGRMVGMGEPLPALVARAALLARCIGLARGGSGVSVSAAQGLLALLDRGVTPVVPGIGSISAGDLGLCAHLVAPLFGEGEAWYQGQRCSGSQALARAGLEPVQLQAKDGLGLINASAVTAAYAALVACAVSDNLLVAAAVAALAAEGYAANLSVLDSRIAAARPGAGQTAAAALFRALHAGSSLLQSKPRSPQDALSFRTMAPVFGVAFSVLGNVTEAVNVELNARADSPLVLAGQGDMLSTPNFHTPGIALAFDSMAIAITQLASASVQRIIKLQTPQLSGLPKYLSPVGGASVGFNAMQKTAAALHAAIRLKATPASLDAVVVSDMVEDHAAHAMLCIRKLDEQLQLYQYLVAVEAMLAAQALDLRGSVTPGAGSGAVSRTVRSVVATLTHDRPGGLDAMRVSTALFDGPLATGLRQTAGAAIAACGLS